MSPADLPPFRYLDRTLAGIHANLALDEALLIEADRADGPPVLRIWELPELAVVMGASCRMHDQVDVDACRRDGVPIARRASGGGTVVIGPGALNVTVALPIASAPGVGAVDEAQRWVLGRIASAIRDEGAPVEVLGSGDLAIGHRKVSGSAQRRLRRWFLIHASILYALPADRISRYLGSPPTRQPNYRAGRPHDQFVSTLPLPRESLLKAIRSAWLPPDTSAAPADVPEERVRELVASKYSDPTWIERF